MARGIRWYSRLAEVQGVGYAGNPHIDRTRLSGFDLKPQVQRGFSSDQEPMLWWSQGEGGSSASPAASYRSGQIDRTNLKAVVRQLEETLELPGQASDYHFALLGVVEAIWRLRYDAPGAFAEIERLCWLDVRLIQADPGAASMLRDGKTEFFGVPAFRQLINLRATEGDLWGAWEVELLARRSGQSPDEALEEAVRALEAEDVR